MKLSIVIPVYNEEKTLNELVQKVLDIQFTDDIEKEILLVDDGSKDSSWEVIKQLEEKNKGIKGLQNGRNIGKTQTVKNGILNSTGDYVVIQDADLEYDPNELVDILNLARSKNLDVVYGDRFGKKNKVIFKDMLESKI
jgi:glycosyltransferase involved in cell wall biosynthesis